MSCVRYEAELAGAVAGGPLTAGIEAHLRECEACRTRLAEGRQVLTAVDRELRAALAIEPSGQWLARVREAAERSAQESPGLPVSWRIAAAVAVAAGLAGSAWLLRPGDRNRPTPAPSTSAALALPTPSTAVPPVVEVSEPHRAAPSATARAVPRAAAPAREPEVLMPPGEEALLLRFVALLRTRPEPSSLVLARSDEDGVEPKPIDVSPLEIQPLAGDLEPAEDGRME